MCRHFFDGLLAEFFRCLRSWSLRFLLFFRRRWLVGLRCFRLFSGLADRRDCRQYRYVIAFLKEDVEQSSGFRRFQLEHGFVRFDVCEDLALIDRSPGLCKPLNQDAAFNGLPLAGHDDRSRHNLLFSVFVVQQPIRNTNNTGADKKFSP